MSIKPIDIKTSLAGTDGVSRIKENQKAQDQGQTELLVQNQNKAQEKFETVHTTEGTEHRAINKEDEDAEKEKGPPDKEKKAKPPTAEEKPEEKAPPLPDPQGIRGGKIDLKA